MTRQTFTLAVALDETDRRLMLDRDAPLPLGYRSAVDRALALRAKGPGWSWPVIAAVMAEYHGVRRAPGWWKRELRAAGAPASPRGRALNGHVGRVAA